MSTNGSTRLEDLVAEAETLYRDVKLAAVRAWKEKTGRRAIGFLPVWVPRELIHAAGMLPVGLMGGGEDVEIIKGDAYFQSYICHIPRSTIEMGLSGALATLDGVIFPSICDVIRNLSGMWKMLFAQQPAWYLDLPQHFDEVGETFFARELGTLRTHLHEVAGTPVDDDALAASIGLYNENRRRVRALYDLRAEAPWLVPTSELYLVMRAGNVLPVEEHNRFLADYERAARASGRPPRDNARVVVAGSFCEQPPLNLIRTIERAGCYVVDDDLVLGNRLVRGDVEVVGDPLTSLVRAFLAQAGEAAFLYRERNKGEQLVQTIGCRRAEGVLFCAPSFCDPALLDQPMLVDAVEAAGVPHTQFKYAENTGQFQVMQEQAGTFADSIKLWGGVA
jgi:benzoyl-CoA reductase subunit C